MISIIIPVYNVAHYLEQCLESVINQTYNDWECILIDDGSKDNSGEICDKWGKIDSRFRIIHQINQGVSAARNRGIKESRGEYIVFIDSDDWVSPNYLKDMTDTFQSDLIVSGVIRHHSNNIESIYEPSQNHTFKLNNEGVRYLVDLNEKFLIFGPCAKLYKTSIINKYHIKFPTGTSLGEDLEFNFHYLEHVNNITTIQSNNYHYRIQTTNSLSTQIRENQFEQDYKQWMIQKKFYIKNGIWVHYSKVLLFRRLWEIIHDGIFRYPKLINANINYLKFIKSIPEIEDLKDYENLYPCSQWIKWGILNKCYILFYGYFLLHRLFHISRFI